ncbi:MAG: efflux RND transporter periplasmic adaptor subunit [Deltaproteobacteria bacterium]|nr:efflux RND transporter periplasmic adaptor subunit [Deltaproteobacteria bacterium]
MKLKKKISVLPAVAAMILLATAAVTGYRCNSRLSPGGNAPPHRRAGPGRIRTVTPGRRSFTVRIPWFGKVESKTAVSIIAPERGRIVSVDAPDESTVMKGTVLFTLGGPRIRARSATLRARIASLRRQAALAGEIVTLKREAVAGKMARREELLSAEESLARIRSRLKAAEEERAALRRMIRIRAPREGVMTRRRVNPGQEVGKGAVLAELVPAGSLRIAATLFPPGNVALTGLSAVAEPASGGSVSVTVTKVLPQRTKEGASTVWLEGPDVDGHFAPGESVSGHLILARHEKALAIPRPAVVYDDRERPFVFVKRPDGYHRQPVKTGETEGGWVEIKEGVGEKDRVVVEGAYELFYRDFNRIYKVED